MQCDEKKQICLNYATNVPEWQMDMALQAVADIAGSCHAQILPQHSGAAAVIRHSNDGSDVTGIQLQTPQQCTQSGSAADAHNFGAVFRRDMI